MTHSTENTTSTNTATVFPNSPQKNQTEGSLRGRKLNWDQAVQPVLSHVLPNLPGKDFCRTAVVSSSTRKVYDSDQVWKEKIKTEMNVDLSDLSKIANISLRDIYVQIAKHRKALLQLRLNRCEEASDIEVMLKIAEMQKNFDPEEAADTLRQASCILRESFDNNVSNYWFETYFPLVFRVFDAQKGIDLKGATDTLRKFQKILVSHLQKMIDSFIHFDQFSTLLSWLVDLVEKQASVNIIEAADTLSEMEKIFAQKGIENIVKVFCDESSYLHSNILNGGRAPDFSKLIKIKELVSSKDEVTCFIGDVQKALSLIKRIYLNTDPAITATISPFDYLAEKQSSRLESCIHFIKIQRNIDLKEAISDLKKARVAIQDPKASATQVCNALLIIIASVEAKIDPKEAVNDLEAAYQIAVKKKEAELSVEAAIRIMKIKPKEAVRVLKETYEILGDMALYRLNEDNLARERIVRRLEQVKVDLPVIPDARILKDIRHPLHKVQILLWLAAQKNTSKAEDIIHDALEIIINKISLKFNFLDEAVSRLAEIKPSEAYKVVHSLGDTDRKVPLLAKVAYEKIKQAKTKADLNEGIKILKEVPWASRLGSDELLPYIFLGLYPVTLI